MENSSDIRVLGGSDVRMDEQIKFSQLNLAVLTSGHKSKPNDAITQFILRNSLDEHSLCRTVASSEPRFEMMNPFSVDFDHHWRRLFIPQDLALVRSLSTHLMRQVPQDTTFESARLSVVFGHFVVVNISQSLPESQKTLSLTDLKLAMEKAGRQRKNWNRGDPTFHISQESQQRSGNKDHGKNEGEQIRPGNLGAASNRHKKGKKSHRDSRSKKQGVRTTFLPTFRGNADDLFHKFSQALTASGFQFVEKDSNLFQSGRLTSHRNIPSDINTSSSSLNYAISILVSKGYEVGAYFFDNRVEIPKASSVSERPLNWVHFTLLGNGILPDARVRFRTTVKISNKLRKLAFGDLHGISPIVWKTVTTKPNDISTTFSSESNDVPMFCANMTPAMQKRVLYIRHYVAERYFMKRSDHTNFSMSIRAKVTRVREFHRNHVDGAEFGTPIEKTEMSLDFDVEVANRIVQNGAHNEMEQFACSILRETTELAMELKKQRLQFH